MNTFARFDIVIAGGTVIDGTRSPRYEADIGVLGDRIAAIGNLSACARGRTLDAAGKMVAPGFIDVHTHDDQAVLVDPRMIPKVSQGVTTVVTGNCGISAAPLPARATLPMPLDLLSRPELRFGSFAQYIARLRAAPSSVNVVPLVGHSSLRACAMDRFDRAADEAEIATMRRLLDEALDEGVFGMSTGLAYPTAISAPTSEIIAVGRALQRRSALYVSHMRNESDQVVDALDETFLIGRELGVTVVISHHKIGNARNFGQSARTLPMIASAMRDQGVCLDCYPYDAGSTMISTDPDMLDGRVLIVASEPHPECAGRDLDDIAREWGIGRQECATRLQPGSAIYFLLSEDDVRDIMRFPDTMIGSDGLPGTDRPHPRLWGTFPRVLGHYCRELGLFPLETAVHKMTGLTAKNLGLADRGQVSEGYAADLVVFDHATVRDRADYGDPQRPAAGIDYVLTNGQVTWAHGAHSGTRAGTVLRRAHDVRIAPPTVVATDGTVDKAATRDVGARSLTKPST